MSKKEKKSDAVLQLWLKPEVRYVIWIAIIVTTWKKKPFIPENIPRSLFQNARQCSGKLIREYILSQPQEQIEFVWHGGEPALLGVEYFRKILDIQKKQADGKKILNAFQTNGTLIDEEWANFLAENHFLCGLSIDRLKIP